MKPTKPKRRDSPLERAALRLWRIWRASPDVGYADAHSALMRACARGANQRKQGYYGWNDPSRCSIRRLEKMLRDHVAKGDPVGVANFCMMIWNRRNTHG